MRRLAQGVIVLEVWQQAQTNLIANNAREQNQLNAATPSPLARLIFNVAGDQITPTHAFKGGRRGRAPWLPLQPSLNYKHQADPALVALIARGYAWRHQLTSGQAASVHVIAVVSGAVRQLLW